MIYSSCIQYPKNNRFIQFYEWQMSFCQGNHCAAILLSYFSSWHDWKIQNDNDYRHFNDIAQTQGDGSPPNQNAYLFFTMADLVDALMGLFGKKSISNGLALLASLDVITIHRNPNRRYCFDRTKYFKFYPEVCNKWLQRNDLLNKSDEDESRLIDDFDNIKMDNQWCNNALPSCENDQAITDNTNYKINENQPINARDESQLIDYSDNAKMDNREREDGQPIIDNTNYKTNHKKQSINARARKSVLKHPFKI